MCPATIRKDVKVLSVAGSQETIFDAETVDGKNVVASNAPIYEPDNYAPLKLRPAGTEALWAREH